MALLQNVKIQLNQKNREYFPWAFKPLVLPSKFTIITISIAGLITQVQDVPEWPGIDKYIKIGKSCKASCMQQVLPGKIPLEDNHEI